MYLCPKCHGEDQSFTSGLGSNLCSMYCHGCGFSTYPVVPGETPYGPLNPRVRVTTGRYTRQAPPPPPLPKDLPPPPYDAMQEVIIDKPVVEEFIAMETAMDKIPESNDTRWDELI